MPETSIPEDISSMPAKDVVSDVLRESRKAMESGARATAELDELKRRADQALDWRAQVDRHPWAAMGLTLAASTLLFMALSRKR